ncbi:hypothetical protein [Paraburkholderia sp. D1E]
MSVNFHWVLFFFGLIVPGVIAIGLSALFGTDSVNRQADARQTRGSDRRD